MITDAQWTVLAGLIDEWWPGEFTETAAAAWRVALDGFDAEQVTGALKIQLAAGGAFRPSVAEIIASVRADPSKPTPEEAYRLIYGPRGVLRARPPRNGSYANEAAMRGAYNDAGELRAAELHPLLGAFVRSYGIERLRMLEVEHEQYGELNRKELREAWGRHCDAMQGRDAAALAAAGTRRSLQKFDPLAALGLDAPEALPVSTTEGA